MQLNPQWTNYLEKLTIDIRELYETETGVKLDFSKDVDIEHFINFFAGKISYANIDDSEIHLAAILRKPKKEENKLFEIILDKKNNLANCDSLSEKNRINQIILRLFYMFMQSYCFDKNYDDFEYDSYMYPSKDRITKALENIEKTKKQNNYEEQKLLQELDDLDSGKTREEIVKKLEKLRNNKN